jgi:DDE superfamily endonuclease
MWQQRGHPVRVPAAGAHRKFAVLGALDYATGQVHWQLSRRTGSEALVSFLDQLGPTWPDEELVVGLDNVGYHTSRRTSHGWRQWPHQICPFCRPAYSPEWNLMERVWRHVQDQRSCPRWWADWPALWEATTALLTHVTARVHQTTRPGIEVVQHFCSSA